MAKNSIFDHTKDGVKADNSGYSSNRIDMLIEESAAAVIDDDAAGDDTVYSSAKIYSMLPEDTEAGTVVNIKDGIPDLPIVKGEFTISTDDPVDEVNITHIGKNIITRPYDQGDGTVSGIEWSVDNDGKIHGSGLSTAATNFQLHANNSTFDLKAGTYTISVIGTMVDSRLYVYHAGTSTVIKLLTSPGSSSFTINEDLTGVGIYFNASSANKNVDINAYVQLEIGSTASDYEEYIHREYNVPVDPPASSGTIEASFKTLPVGNTVNNIWCDTGDSSITYKKLTTLS